VTGLDLASLHSWAGPSQPAWSLAHASDQPFPSAHARVLFYACMNSAKVIAVHKKNVKNRVLQMVVSGVGFLMIFFSFLHINMHHHTGTEKGSEHT
jgi:hypothetical protein